MKTSMVTAWFAVSNHAGLTLARILRQAQDAECDEVGNVYFYTLSDFVLDDKLFTISL